MVYSSWDTFKLGLCLTQCPWRESTHAKTDIITSLGSRLCKSTQCLVMHLRIFVSRQDESIRSIPVEQVHPDELYIL